MGVRRGWYVLLFRYFITAAFLTVLLVAVANMVLQGFTAPGNECPKSVDWFLEDPELKQDDPALVEYIRKYHLQPPSTKLYREVIYNLKDPSPLGSVIQAIFKGQRRGFFIEAGAYNGIQESNSLILERDFGWTGLLVEGNSFLLPELRLAHRKAWIGDVCLAMTPYPQKVKFIHHEGIKSAGMIKYKDVGSDPSNKNMQVHYQKQADDFITAGYVECFPVFSLLSALNITRVDYLSLDVEGAELRVLENIPFERLDIRVVSAEHWIVSGGIPALDEFFTGKGYTRLGVKGSDAFYAQNGYLEKYGFDKKTVKGVE